MTRQLLLTGAKQIQLETGKLTLEDKPVTKNFTVVNELPADIMEKVEEAVKAYHKGTWRKVHDVLTLIGAGFCGTVWELSDEYALKVDKGTYSSGTRDGEIMHALQGLPMIPKLYMYSEDNRFMVVQRIKGVDVRKYRNGEAGFTLRSFAKGKFQRLVDQFTIDVLKRGWIPTDLHDENTMIDTDGNFWIVDVGIFDPMSEWFSKRRLKRCEDYKRSRPAFNGLSDHLTSVWNATYEGRRKASRNNEERELQKRFLQEKLDNGAKLLPWFRQSHYRTPEQGTPRWIRNAIDYKQRVFQETTEERLRKAGLLRTTPKRAYAVTDKSYSVAGFKSVTVKGQEISFTDILERANLETLGTPYYF